ncbi:MAG: hypothetical protein DRQ37_00600 [Gammaproteobacteria bacterium]|nr:MAG: hypothetical protein DRQ37_00600 [Gammaproteobacteria bacterium]
MGDEQHPFEDRIRSLTPVHGLLPKYQDQVIAQGTLLKYKKKQFVFKQGDRDGYAYYLLEGELELYSDEQLVKSMEGSNADALYPLAQLQPRQMSGRAKSPVIVLRLERAMLDRLLTLDDTTESEAKEDTVPGEADESADWMSNVLQSELFARVPPANIQRIFTTLESIEVKAGEAVVRQGEPGEYYYIIGKGRAMVTRKAVSDGQPMKLAELKEGDCFGEEALVSESTRNASVSMLTAGELMRMTKDDFVELIKKPALREVRYTEAKEMVRDGSAWLDVRLVEEHKDRAITNSINIPLTQIRKRLGDLEPGSNYIVYCDTGSRSSAAAFVLTQNGFDACYLSGGLIEVTDISPEEDAKDPTLPELTTEPDSVEFEITASVLEAELVRADAQLEDALKLKAETTVTREIREERETLEKRRAEADAAIAEAKRLKMELIAAKRAAEMEGKARRERENEQLMQLKRQAEERLRQEKQKLDAEYARQARALEEMRNNREQSQAKMDGERAKLEAEAEEAKQRLEEAKRIKKEAEAARRKMDRESEKAQRKQEEEERKLREEITAKIAAERRQLEAEFARTAEELEKARCERAAAEAARRAAGEEAKKIVAEQQAEFDKRRAKEEAELQAERERLAEESARIRAALEDAKQARADAESARKEAETRAAEIKQSQAQAERVGMAVAQKQLKAELKETEAEVTQADTRVHEAEDAHREAEAAQEANKEEMTRKQAEIDRMRAQLEAEMNDWVSEQDALEDSTTRRQIRVEEAEVMARVRAKAEEAKRNAQAANVSMLDDIADQLGGDE